MTQRSALPALALSLLLVTLANSAAYAGEAMSNQPLNNPPPDIQTLDNQALGNSYIPQATALPCPTNSNNESKAEPKAKSGQKGKQRPDKKKGNAKAANTESPDCPPSRPGALEDKILRDAEQQNVQQQLQNPNLNNPDALPAPSQLPPQELTPQQQQIINQIRQLQH